MNNIDPKKIAIHNRFDVLLKYMYIISKERSYKCDFYENSYKEHLEIWNNFTEYDDKTKNSYSEFTFRYDNLLKSIKKDGYDFNQDGVPLLNLNLLNGSHRTAACLYFNKELKYREGKNIIDGQEDCSYTFFQNLNRDGKFIPEYFLDQAAIVCSDIYEDAKVVCLFPSSNDNSFKEAREILKKIGIIYEKSIELTELGTINLMKELYKDESWAESNDGDGYRQKAKLCFNGKSKLTVFLVRMNIQQSVFIKDKIRNFYKIGNHSIHINDTQEETKRISRALFNKNSMHFLNNANPTKRFIKMFRHFENSFVMNGEVCITASMIMAAYGLREANDIDYLHLDDLKYQDRYLISSHNKYINDFYPDTLENIIIDPRNHFYYHGFKFISLDILKKLKEKRNELKDIKDIRLMEEQYGL
jgi:hypothetical protein